MIATTRDLATFLWVLYAWWGGLQAALSEEGPGATKATLAESLQGAFRGLSDRYMPPRQWDPRYVRTSLTYGMVVRLCQPVPNSGGIWTVVTPSLSVSTLKLGNLSSVSSNPRAEIDSSIRGSSAKS